MTFLFFAQYSTCVSFAVYRRMAFYLKPGDPLDNDRTNVTVQITDMFGDSATVTFNVQVCFSFNSLLSFPHF